MTNAAILGTINSLPYAFRRYFPNAASATGASAPKVSSSPPDCVAIPFLLPNSNVSNHSPLRVRAFFTPVFGSTAQDFDSVVNVPFFGSKPHAFHQGRAVLLYRSEGREVTSTGFAQLDENILERVDIQENGRII